MAKEDSKSGPNNKANCRVTKEIDLRDPARYAASIEWLRNNVVLKNATGAKILQLDVLVADGAVSLFMNTENHYVMGFRGADKAYLLNDDGARRFEALLEAEIKPTPIEILNGLHTRHGGGAGGLETFVDNARGRVFRRKELNCAQKLSRFVHKGEVYDDLRKPLSLLVCMICESARFMVLEKDFTNLLYYDCDVWADESIQAYAKAKVLVRLADDCVPLSYRLPLAVEVLQKRAAEMDELLLRIKAVLKRKDNAALITEILKGSLSGNDQAASAAGRFRELCNQLKLSNPEDISNMILYCKNESAVRAAKQGVAYPKLPARP